MGIPCAQAMQEASRVTQRRRAPLEPLQESKHKIKLSAHVAASHFTKIKKPSPSADKQTAQFALQGVRKTHEKLTQSETTLRGTTKTEEFMQSQG